MVVALLAVSAGPPGAQPGAKQDDPAKGAGPDADEEHRRAAEQVAGGIDVEVLTDGTWSRVKRVEKPLLYYGDPTRAHDRGSVWAWGEKGRPVALVELFQNVRDRQRWVFTVCNTSGRRVRASRAGAAWWAENDSATELKDIPGAPAPAADPAQRQRQLKLLAQRFTGHEFWDPNNTRYDLRRLDRPLHAYRDEAAGLLDGALFALTNGTNPEIMLFVEARADPKGGPKAAWQFAVGRLADAELHVEFDGRGVFTAPRAKLVAGRDKPYWAGFITLTPDGDPRRP
jgi:hypothetical protein